MVGTTGGKADVVVMAAEIIGPDSSVLAVGDRGGIDGNDFGLLARCPLSLSVDQVSADLTRCWNLGWPHTGGPDLLAAYLDALRPSGDGTARFEWPPATWLGRVGCAGAPGSGTLRGCDSTGRRAVPVGGASLCRGGDRQRGCGLPLLRHQRAYVLQAATATGSWAPKGSGTGRRARATAPGPPAQE